MINSYFPDTTLVLEHLFSVEAPSLPVFSIFAMVFRGYFKPSINAERMGGVWSCLDIGTEN